MKAVVKHKDVYLLYKWVKQSESEKTPTLIIVYE